MLHAGPFARQRIRLIAMINVEGLTIPDGELGPGTWGEGFVDRRHPHTWLHELIVSFGDSSLSLSAGKGFAPFGTDDPMSRPVLRYPVNHHLAQVLERAVVIGAARRGPIGLEAGLFNGDEPERPAQWPNFGRFGDSWSARLSVLPARGVELQASHARVASPEHRGGQGTTQRKWSAAARAEPRLAGIPAYLLAEWARTSEAGGFFRFSSLLLEAAGSSGRHHGHVRLERTERPEEQRTLDPFRSVRPHLDNSILGTTRWRVATFGYSVDALAASAPMSAVPLIEVSFGDVTSLTPVSFNPASIYGGDTFWSMSLGVRVGWGARLHRMGRYGAAGSAAAPLHAGQPDHRH